MSEFKKGDAVQARTLRGNKYINGTVEIIRETPSGTWVTVKPDEEDKKSFRTRPSLVIKTLV